MHRLSALALGPVLARAAPEIGNGIADHATSIHQWINRRLADPSGKFATALTRSVDRSWRSLEIALAGEEFLQTAIVSGVDRALIEQIRQFIAVASLPDMSGAFRKQLRIELQKARQLDLIPGPLPTADALSALVVDFPKDEEESPLADARELLALGKEFHSSRFPLLARFVGRSSKTPSPLLLTSIRYFFSREVASDLFLLRDLRVNLELPSPSLRNGFDRLADAFDRFITILTTLLEESTASIEKEPEIPEVSNHASPPPPPLELGFSVYGQHLIAPIRMDADGIRSTPCPVCLTSTVVQAEGWVSLRCDSCGTEFHAIDGTVPLPPLPGVKPTTSLPAAKNLHAWIESGGPARWIEYNRGSWDDSEFSRLADILRVSQYWPLDLNEVRNLLAEMTELYRERGTNWSVIPSSRVSKKAVRFTPPSLEAPAESVHTSDYYHTIDGNRWVPCPLCRSFNVEVPPLASGEIRLRCSGCKRIFILDLKTKSPAVLPPPPISAPPKSLWGKFRSWFS